MKYKNWTWSEGWGSFEIIQCKCSEVLNYFKLPQLINNTSNYVFENQIFNSCNNNATIKWCNCPLLCKVHPKLKFSWCHYFTTSQADYYIAIKLDGNDLQTCSTNLDFIIVKTIPLSLFLSLSLVLSFF